MIGEEESDEGEDRNDHPSALGDKYSVFFQHFLYPVSEYSLFFIDKKILCFNPR